ncbi:MAG: glycogen debranching enzyme family protein [Opitutaceae bacterium]|nr:glycogen debranching enzyme family protein [Opitutaceae bacterium]
MFKDLEWLETDGLGGFASGRVDGVRSRRYHALLLPATGSLSERFVLVNGFEAWVSTDKGRYPLSSQKYSQDVVSPDTRGSMKDFTLEPWPTWQIRLPDGSIVVQEIFVPKGITGTVVSRRIEGKTKRAVLEIRPLFSGRDIHSLHKKNKKFRMRPKTIKGCLKWTPYKGVPSTVVYSNGKYRHKPQWYLDFKYDEEHKRGLEFEEDLAAPGVLQWDLSKEEAVAVFLADNLTLSSKEMVRKPALDLVKNWREVEQKRRTAFSSIMERSADCFLVKNGEEKSLIAGYPLFAEKERDTFIAMRGICLSLGNLDDAQSLLLKGAEKLSKDLSSGRNGNPLDISLWFIVAAYEFLVAYDVNNRTIDSAVRERLLEIGQRVLRNCLEGEHRGFQVEADGLLRLNENGQSLTWMDAMIGGMLVTPRVGKPVEIQALWLNALKIGSLTDDSLEVHFQKGLKSFQTKFWNKATACLYDVIDTGGSRGEVDGRIRPNQLFAIGGLPFPLLKKEKALKVLGVIEQKLLTPLGLRSLDPEDLNYRGFCRGGVWERGGAYHQGTVWPWLMGSYVEGWMRYHEMHKENLQVIKQRFMEPFFEHLQRGGIGHISEIVDGNPPHQLRGCPFQAVSLGEFLRISKKIEEMERSILE